jgi:hypothetical protein
MGTQLIIRSLTVRTRNDEATYEFREGVNAIVGPIGTGKSSMLELIKFGLGGSAQIMPAVHDNVTVVILRVTAGTSTFDMTRAIDGRLIDVHEAISGEYIATWSTHRRKNRRRAAEELLGTLGLPMDLRVPRRRTRPSGESVPLSFFDVYRYLYLSQNTIDISVVGHHDRNLDNKRRAVFELLYQLTNPRLLELVAQRGRLAQDLERAKADARVVETFLRQTEGLDQESLRLRLQEATAELGRSERRLDEVRTKDRPTDSDLMLLEEADSLRVQVANADTELRQLREQLDEAGSVLAQLTLDEQALGRGDVASRSLSGLDFTVCPRCLQGIQDRQVAAGHCTLCLQSQEPESHDARADLLRLRDQRREIESLREADLKAQERLLARLAELRSRLDDASLRLYNRESSAHDSPRLREVEETARAAEAARARVDRVTAALARWASLEDRLSETAGLESRIKQLGAEEAEMRRDLQAGNERIRQLSDVFDEVVRNFGVPWYEPGDIDPDTYLPRLGHQSFDQLSVGGARKTLVNLAYHLANLIVSIEDFEVGLPTLMIVDSPRKNVGENEDDRAVADAIYRRFRLLQDASQRPFQLIVADNDLPASTREWLVDPIQLTYSDPLVPGVEHPGEDVETLADVAGEGPMDD